MEYEDYVTAIAFLDAAREQLSSKDDGCGEIVEIVDEIHVMRNKINQMRLAEIGGKYCVADIL